MSDIKPDIHETIAAAIRFASTETSTDARAHAFTAALSGGMGLHDRRLAERIARLLEPRAEDRT